MSQDLPDPVPGRSVAPDPWAYLRQHTPARIALGRTGVSLPTREVLNFSLAHAQARDAIHQPLDAAALAQALADVGHPIELSLHSRVRDRHEYLLRPDLGRRLNEESLDQLHDWRARMRLSAPIDLVLVMGDGLSSLGIQRHAPALVAAVGQALGDLQGGALVLGPLVLVEQARVAVADEVGRA
jgi:ethanolamine ammonia-lyase small subunit